MLGYHRVETDTEAGQDKTFCRSKLPACLNSGNILISVACLFVYHFKIVTCTSAPPGTVAYACKLSVLEDQAVGLRAPGQSGLQNETMS